MTTRQKLLAALLILWIVAVLWGMGRAKGYW